LIFFAAATIFDFSIGLADFFHADAIAVSFSGHYF
jgi:hypothetical protein